MNCASLLLLLCVLLLAALGPFAAAARREPTMAATGDQGDSAQAKLAWMGMAPAKGLKQRVIMRKQESTDSNRFRTRKFSSTAKNPFDGRLPFTADYHNVRRHPPSHN
ncbi:hypothetical protein CFC21_087860 [Triticum aestivum]|uniref:Uncharacterized protein n=3 Tax=Triticum TaxID=4564 RepID=A0A9R0YJQ6_TRITD|nr:uncharacterized protein LOC119320226 [Triticum dicoccoides]XP_044409320.1 uncharacterized protein LOC123134024 [Triticum aestivum]KAF7084182.1 hypothetical protein CFC21_087860 [Triticum aestivum]VAI56711.1 unnamed protein product [Triticum turgidum subsp. durum]